MAYSHLVDALQRTNLGLPSLRVLTTKYAIWFFSIFPRFHLKNDELRSVKN